MEAGVVAPSAEELSEEPLLTKTDRPTVIATVVTVRATTNKEKDTATVATKSIQRVETGAPTAATTTTGRAQRTDGRRDGERQGDATSVVFAPTDVDGPGSAALIGGVVGGVCCLMLVVVALVMWKRSRSGYTSARDGDGGEEWGVYGGMVIDDDERDQLPAGGDYTNKGLVDGGGDQPVYDRVEDGLDGPLYDHVPSMTNYTVAENNTDDEEKVKF